MVAPGIVGVVVDSTTDGQVHAAGIGRYDDLLDRAATVGLGALGRHALARGVDDDASRRIRPADCRGVRLVEDVYALAVDEEVTTVGRDVVGEGAM